jgi:ankyrin repeat protein
MALLSALPEAESKPEAAASVATDAPTWMRTALFGTASQLSTLLDTGLDANAETKNGTTLLMASSAEVDKVKLLLSRGAKATTRTKSGTDALTIAAAYRGTSAAINALLDAGVSVDPPDGVRVRNSPLVLASMTGDLDNVRLLLKRGASPSEKALAEAVTFGYPEVVRTLIEAGADANIVEGSGINLLHWATIANRPDVIPVLAAAHVAINDQDDNGFTPLMYAATIDFGDTNVLKALLNGGADKKIVNREGRTPLAQARLFGHSALERALQ